MKNHLLVPDFNLTSTHARILAAHHSLGSQPTDVAMPETVRINRGRELRFRGALAGLNAPRFTALKTDICVGRYGFVIEKTWVDGTVQVKVAVPVYSAIRKAFQGTLFTNIASVGDSNFDTEGAVEVVPSEWADARCCEGGHWVNELNWGHYDFYGNPFDHAQALLPDTLKQTGSEEAINTASLCGFLSEVFRFLNPEDRALYLEIMVQGNRFTKFLNYAASTRSHHNHEHGLLLHTAETVANVLLKALATTPEERASSKPPFDLSLTLLAALLHDAAKVDEYYRLAPDVYSTNLNCELLGHEQTMLKWIAVACAVSGCYPTDRELQLEHAICAVKKQHDQSGARKRKTPESFVLHEADCASARAFDKSETSVLLTHQFVQGETA